MSAGYRRLIAVCCALLPDRYPPPQVGRQGLAAPAKMSWEVGYAVGEGGN